MKNVQKFLAAGEAAMDAAQWRAEEEADQAEQRFFERIEALKDRIDQNYEWLFDWMNETTFGDARYKVSDPYARSKEFGKAFRALAVAQTTGDMIRAGRLMQAVIEHAAEWKAQNEWKA